MCSHDTVHVFYGEKVVMFDNINPSSFFRSLGQPIYSGTCVTFVLVNKMALKVKFFHRRLTYIAGHVLLLNSLDWTITGI